MSDERDPVVQGPDDALPSVEQVARLDAFLDDLVNERRPASPALNEQELADRLLAAQMRLAREEVEQPTPAFLSRLEETVSQAVAQERRRGRRPGLSRGGFLRTVVSLAGGAGLGVAAVEGVSVAQDLQRPHTLVAAGNERWYDIAAADEVQDGGTKPFSAGGLLGFLLNDGGQLHAVSAVCTHMGCRLKPTEGGAALHCLCHASRFTRRGTVAQGLAPSPLPAITVRVENGRVYALGTRETV
ncbi:MAG TPA: Rieske (2Fe-2S) protein [Chloroflexota bacterium]|jgi:Rieske Fe-S protein|nr:Rieske (2Fe-2S) protein [Chloroflexota bacterium]